MFVPRKILALAAGATLALTAAAIAPSYAQQPAAPNPGADETIVVDDATFEWIEKSQVAALIEGNLESIELEIGKTVEKNGTIGHLYRQKAKLTLAKAELAAKNVASLQKAAAQKDQAVSVVARNDRMLKRDPLLVPKEDQEKAIADLKVSMALIKEAQETQALAEAELELAKNQLEEHTIKAPFAGVIFKIIKHPGESVSAREPVVEMGNLDELRVFAFIPAESAYRVTEGTVVEFQPRIGGPRGGTLPVERKKFRGVITFVDPQIQPVGEEGTRIYAKFKNETHELRPGLKGVLTIHLNTAGAPAAARAGQGGTTDSVVPASTASAPAGGLDLPALPPR